MSEPGFIGFWGWCDFEGRDRLGDKIAVIVRIQNSTFKTPQPLRLPKFPPFPAKLSYSAFGIDCDKAGMTDKIYQSNKIIVVDPKDGNVRK